MRFLLKSLLSLLILTLGIGYFLGETTIGLQTTLKIVSRFLPGKLQVEHVGGKLFSEFYLINLSYHQPKQDIAIHSLHMRWNPWYLLYGTLKITHLNTNGIDIKTITTANEKHENFKLEDLKFLQHAIANEMGFYHVTLTQNQKTVLKFQELELQKQNDGGTTFYGKIEESELRGKLFLTWSPQPTWSLTLNGHDINPGIVWPEWPGKIDIALSTQRNTDNMTFNLQQLQGTLRHYPVHGRVSIQWKNNQLAIQEAHLSIANSQLSLQGSLTDNWNIKWNITIPNLSTLLPKASGKFFSTGSMVGPKLTPTLRATLQGDRLAIEQQRINQLKGQIDFTLKPNTVSSIELTAYDLKFPDYAIKKIAFDVTGQAHPTAQHIIGNFDIAINKQHYLNMLLTIPQSIRPDNYLTQPLTAF